MIDERSVAPKQGIFFDGQIYDAYEFICGLIRSAKARIVLIDNYLDETVLTMLDKREMGVSATIFDVKVFTKSHDRFLILDNQVYLIGASLKDLGKKWLPWP